MAGIGQKIKDVAHKVTGGTHQKHEEGATGTGTTYSNVGATYGAAGEPGIAGPVAPGERSDVMAPTGTTDVGYAEEAGLRATIAGPGAGYAEGAEMRSGEGEVPVAVQQTTTSTTTRGQGEGMAEGVAVAGTGAPETCAQEFFTKVEDRPVVKERVELIQEHRPVEKEFVVETRATGAERATGSGQVEHLGTTESVVGVTEPKAPCE